MSNDLPDLEHELDPILEDEQQREAFRITDDSGATWAMRRLAQLERQAETYNQIHEREIERIEQWLSQVKAPLERNASYFRSLLADYARRERLENNRKTITLPHGKVATRPATDKWEIDAEQLLAFLKDSELTDLIKVKEEPSLSALKQYLTVTDDLKVLTPAGEIVPHIRIQRGDLSVSVSVNPTSE